MSNFRDKAREVKARGVEQRGNFEPTGLPVKIYNYWLERSLTDRALRIRSGRRKENFCHFWRVVAFWAPLMALGLGIKAVFFNLFFVVLGVVAILSAVTYQVLVNDEFAKVFLVSVVTLVLLVGNFLGLVGSVSLLFYNGDSSRRLVGFPSAKASKALVVLGPVGALVGLVSYGLSRFYERVIKGRGEKISMGVIVVSVLAMLAAFTHAYGIGLTLLGVIIGVAISIALFGFIFFIGSLVDFISGKRAINEEEKEKAIEEWLHHGGPWPFEDKKPGRVSRFCTGLADFLVLAVQVVRVKKWKICPTVDIKTQ